MTPEQLAELEQCVNSYQDDNHRADAILLARLQLLAQTLTYEASIGYHQMAGSTRRIGSATYCPQVTTRTKRIYRS
jgi:hypothetical protein